MAVVLTVITQVKQGDEATAERLLTECAIPSRAEPGILEYHVCRSNRNPGQFLIFEMYRDKEARDSHRQSEHVKRLIVDQLLPLTDTFEVASYESFDS